MSIPQVMPAIQGITMNWNGPITHTIIQCLYLNRIVAMFALTFFSERSKKNILSLAAQLFSFIGISKLNWIELSQNLAYPLKEIVARGGKLLHCYQSSIKNLKMTTHFLVDQQGDLKSILQSIYNYTSSFFDNSMWCRESWISNQTGRSIIYRITLQNQVLVPSSDTFSPQLTDFSIRGIVDFTLTKTAAVFNTAN